MAPRLDPRVIKAAAVTATALGALLHATKGAVLLINGADLSLVPTMVTLFALGMTGFAFLLLTGRRSIAAVIALVASGVTVVAGVMSLLYQIASIAPEDAGSPTGVKLAYALGTFGIFVGLVALAISAWRRPSLSRIHRIALLVAAVAWFPLEGLTAVLADGWGLLLAGLVWFGVPFCIAGGNWESRNAGPSAYSDS